MKGHLDGWREWHEGRAVELGGECAPGVDDHAEAFTDGLKAEVGIGSGVMTGPLQIGATPRGASSESLRIADTFLGAYQDAPPSNEIET